MEYRELAHGEVIERGDEFEVWGEWVKTMCVGKKVGDQRTAIRYRRKIDSSAANLTSFFQLHNPPPIDTAHEQLTALLAKEAEHIALVEEGNRLRDKTIDLGQEVNALRAAFADKHRDRLFVVGGRLFDTTGGKLTDKPVENVTL
jgi:hypothetical protein